MMKDSFMHASQWVSGVSHVADNVLLQHQGALLLLQDVQSLLQDPPGVHTSSNVSFGLKQLVPESSSSQLPYEQPVSSYYGPGHDVSQHISQPPQPFSQILGTAHDVQPSSETEQKRLFCFRQFTVRNTTTGDVHLLDVRFSPKLPLWPNTMALTDDAGISAVVRDTNLGSTFRSSAVPSSAAENVSDMPDQQQRQRSKKKKLSKKQRQLQAQGQQQQQQSVQSNEPKRESQQQQQQADQQLPAKPQPARDSSSLQSGQAEGKHQDGVQCVMLHAGEEYPVTVVLNCLDGPHRK